MWVAMKKQNLGIVEIEEEEIKVKGTKNILNKFIEEVSLNRQVIQIKMLQRNAGALNS